MSDEIGTAPHSPSDQGHGPNLIATAPVEGAEAYVMPSIAADRLYQFAALTAVLFFLVTLL
jgi:hypothetical protein